MTTIFIVATETSGDIHGGNLARQLKAIDPTIRLVGVGGGHMRDAGVEILIDPTAHATVGVFEAVRHINRYARIYRLLQSALRTWLPDAVVLIDSPDFNLRFAGRVKDHGIPVIYYISPQIWAWRKGRIKTIRKVVRTMIVTYRLNPATAYLFGPLVWLNTRLWALVNIVAGREIVPEMYQWRAKPQLLAREAISMIQGGRLPEIRKALGVIRHKLGSPGASRRAAEEVLKTIGR